MPSPREKETWKKIELDLNKSRKLMLDGKYSEAVVIDSSVLEQIVRMQINRACLVSQSTKEDIENLYKGNLIGKTSRNNYYKIIMYAEKVAAGEKSYAADANDSFLILQTEVQKYIEKRRREFITPSSVRKSGIDIPYTGIGDYKENNEAKEEVKPKKNKKKASRDRVVYRKSSDSIKESRQDRRDDYSDEAVAVDSYKILRFLIPVVLVVLLLILVKLIFFKHSDEPKDVKPIETRVESIVESTQESQFETLAETEPAPEPVITEYKTTVDKLNVRSKPSTEEGSRIIKQLPKGTKVTVKSEYNDEWTVIEIDGEEAYVASKYLEKSEVHAESELSRGNAINDITDSIINP